MPPAAPVPTTAPPMSRTTRVSNPPPPGEGGTFRTVNVICDVPDTDPRVAVVVVVYVVSAGTVGAGMGTFGGARAARGEGEGGRRRGGDGAWSTFGPAARW